MRIRIRSAEKNLNLILPTRLLFSRPVMKLICLSSRYWDEDYLNNLSPEAIDVLFAEFRRIKNRYGSWELVNVESADGETVQIVF